MKISFISFSTCFINFEKLTIFIGVVVDWMRHNKKFINKFAMGKVSANWVTQWMTTDNIVISVFGFNSFQERYFINVKKASNFHKICVLIWHTIYENLTKIQYLNTNGVRFRYASLCRGLKYLLKILYFIQDYPKALLNFWFLRLFVWTGRKHCPMSEKLSQKWMAFIKFL